MMKGEYIIDRLSSRSFVSLNYFNPEYLQSDDTSYQTCSESPPNQLAYLAITAFSLQLLAYECLRYVLVR